MAHRPALVDYATPIVGCRARAEDVVQEAWLRFSRQPGDADIRHPASYLYRIVRNLALDQTRRTATEKAQPGGDEILAELPASAAAPMTCAAARRPHSASSSTAPITGRRQKLARSRP
nr:sigma factor [Pseudomonas sp. NMI795_08]